MRVTQVQDAGGGIQNTSYLQNDVYHELRPAPIGEATKAKQLEYDGLGRLKSVCEITSGANSGSCGQQTGGYVGYLTTYLYDTPPYVNSLTVTQNGQPNGAGHRPEPIVTTCWAVLRTNPTRKPVSLNTSTML